MPVEPLKPLAGDPHVILPILKRTADQSQHSCLMPIIYFGPALSGCGTLCLFEGVPYAQVVWSKDQNRTQLARLHFLSYIESKMGDAKLNFNSK